MAENDSLVTTTRVQLPSRGWFYDGALPDGWVELAPMTTKEEKLLLSPRSDRRELLHAVVKRCLRTDAVPLEDMLVADDMYLLLELRSMTYGPDYRFNLICSRCQSSSVYNITLPEGLRLRILTVADKEPFDVDLPVSKKKLSLRLLRVKDEQEIQRSVKRQSSFSANQNQESVGGGADYIHRLAKHIVAIDDEEVEMPQAMKFVESMLGRDSLAMRRKIEECDCGVELVIETFCQQCSSPIEQLMPFTAEFFRPSVVQDARQH